MSARGRLMRLFTRSKSCRSRPSAARSAKAASDSAIECGVLDDRAVLDELGRLRSGGLAIGLTVSEPRQADVIRRALAVRVNGANPFQVVQATWNVLEPSAGDALAAAKQDGWGVIVKEALANGRLSNRAV